MYLEEYTTQFFGFGRWDAPVWFVGTEEAGNPTLEQFERRLRVWAQRGRHSLEDAPTFYPAVGQTHWHGKHAHLEPTWRQLIRMLLVARGHPDTEDALLAHQQDQFGASAGNVCLTELSPTPAPSHRHWPYAKRPDAPEWLRTRAEFMRRILPRRVAMLREKIALHRPRAVVFYFWKPRESAEAIAGGEFESLVSEELLGFQRGGTQYFVTGHPATGYPDTYFQGLGNYFHAKHRELFVAQPPSLLEKAICIAAGAHRWAKRKNGTPYVLHPLRMMCRVNTEDAKVVAVLHDVVEDTHWTLDALRGEGFPEHILHALDCVTKRAGESYDAFVARSASNPLARKVKLADLEDNMNLRELPELTPNDSERMAKYLKAWKRLTASQT